jgi:hypothetical protein
MISESSRCKIISSAEDMYQLMLSEQLGHYMEGHL